MPLEEPFQLTPPEAQSFLPRVSDNDPPRAREQDLDPTFVEMAQLVEVPLAFVEDPYPFMVEGPLAFVEDPYPPMVPAVDPDPDPEPIDALTFALAKVLEIIPDVQPDHVTALVHSYLDQDGDLISPALLVEQILHQLFENLDYPKVEKKGKKRKNAEEPVATGSSQNGGERPKKKVKIDYRTTQRNKDPSVAYRNLALVSTFSLLFSAKGYVCLLTPISVSPRRRFSFYP